MSRVLRVGIENVLRGLDPSAARLDQPGMVAASAIFDPLFAYDLDGIAQPYLAERAEAADDFQRWTITLREGVRFHDGRPLDAAAVVAGLEAHRASLLTGGALTSVVDVSGRGRTVVVAMDAPWASFPAFLTGQLGMVTAPGADGFPVGTGPYRLRSLDAMGLDGDAHPLHWRPDRPAFDRIEVRTVVDQPERARHLVDGSIDIMHGTDTEVLAALDRVPEVRVLRSNRHTDTGCVMINTSKAALADRRVRTALAHATDRKGLIEEVFDGIAPPTNSPFGEDQPYGRGHTFPEFDPGRARALLTEAGVDTLRLELITLTRPKNARFGGLLASQWAAVGVELSVVQLDQQDLILRALVGDYDVAEWHQFGNADPDENTMFWHPAARRPPGELSLNMTRIDDAALGEALDVGRATDDVATRHEAYRAVAERLGHELPYLWLLRAPYGLAHRTDLVGAGHITLPSGAPGLGLIGGRFTVADLERIGR